MYILNRIYQAQEKTHEWSGKLYRLAGLETSKEDLDKFKSKMAKQGYSVRTKTIRYGVARIYAVYRAPK